jgi:hypothetical protein
MIALNSLELSDHGFLYDSPRTSVQRKTISTDNEKLSSPTRCGTLNLERRSGIEDDHHDG